MYWLKWQLQEMKEAAYRRHAAVVTALHGHDKDEWLEQMVNHKKFVDLVYSPWVH
jgi:hypothetical protein